MTPPAGYTESGFSGRYIIYLRKSRADLEAEQRGEGETLARHERALLELARRQRLNIVDIYREISVGRDHRRPAGHAAGACRGGRKGYGMAYWCTKWSALPGGDTIDQGIVARRSNSPTPKSSRRSRPTTRITSLTRSTLSSAFYEPQEYKTSTAVLQRGRIASIKEGKYVGSRPPYGYDRKKLEKGQGLYPCPKPRAGPGGQADF